jgi:Lon protease-like protein
VNLVFREVEKVIAMSRNPFVSPFESLPNTLPIFPLPGAILMPQSELPLNIFEPRYINMINDALGDHRMIGMIQPDPNEKGEGAVYLTGCAGRITQFRETSDGRYELVLSGVCRFDLVEELATTRGYRLIVPDWSRFACDYVDNEEQLQGEQQRLMTTLEHYLESRELEADLPMFRRMPVEKLIDALTMALPFTEQEKQMLLETVEPEQRLANFITLIYDDIEVPGSATRH